jgi:aquaporin Z
MLMVSIYALGGVSGANFNPAVSFSIACSTSMNGPGEMSWKVCAMYCLTQIAAGVLAAFCYCILYWNAFSLGPSKGFGIVSTGLCEAVYTFMLCFVVLNVAVAKKESGNQFYGLAIGFVIIAGAYGAGVVSGGCFNPAVAIGVDVSSLGVWCIAYTFFEICGALLAVIAFKVVRPEEFGALPTSEPSLTSRLVSEFLGTYMLVLTVGLNILGNSPAGAFSIAAALMCMIYAVGDVSGAHFNPAVTAAVLGSRLDASLTPAIACYYMLVQILGGVVAAFTYTFIYFGNTFPLGPLPGANWGHVFFAEALFTFLLCYVVLCTALSEETKLKQMLGLAIGSCVTVGGFAIGSISGGSLNPAVSFGIAASQILNGGLFYKAFIYSLFEFIGAGAAVGLLKVTHSKAKS